jgi:molybdopterin synthase catalytic subunit
MSLFRVLETPLLVADAVAAVSAPDVGGIDLFLGAVRNHNDGRAVTRLEYHAYVSMAEKEMQRIAEEIAHEIPGVRLAALHRIGSLGVGDLAVICAAGAVHRGEAFTACRALIDRIKHRVPIWKREHGPDGPYWVGWEDARCGDGHTHAQGQHHHDQ